LHICASYFKNFLGRYAPWPSYVAKAHALNKPSVPKETAIFSIYVNPSQEEMDQ